MKKAGRPSYQIDPSRLRELRDEAKLTQEELGQKVFGVQKDGESAKKSYGRIEQKGKTSEKTARKIAGILAGVLSRSSEEMLLDIRGGKPAAPPDRVKEIEAQLKIQVGGGANTSLINKLEQNSDSDNTIHELAEEISSRLEMAQFEQNSDELAELAQLTGWTQEELQVPNSRHGYWLLITNTLGSRETQIALGIHEVIRTIEMEGAEWLNGPNPSDLRITLSEDSSWLRVRLQHPFNPEYFKQFSFVRCVPNIKGLTWVKPTERDRWILNDLHFGIRGWAFRHANYVTGFKAEDVWPRELLNLRLLLKQSVTPVQIDSASAGDRYKTIAVFKGSLDELPEQIRENFRRDRSEHALITNRLASGFWEDVLSPQLAELPPAWWQIRATETGVAVSTTHFPSMREMERYGCDPYGRTFEISLVELTPTGDLRAAPWRKRCVQNLVERLQKDLTACVEQVDIGPKRPAWAT